MAALKSIISLFVIIIATISQLFLVDAQLSNLFDFIKNPLSLDFDSDSEPNHGVLLQDLDDFFHLNEFNDHIIENTKSSIFNESTSIGETSSDATNYMIKTMHAKYKMSIRGFNSMITSYYDSPEEKKLASSPRANQTLCGQQLDYMLTVANHGDTHISRGSNLNLMRILDTFGRPEVSTFESQLIWLGNYPQCMSSRLLIPIQDRQQDKQANTHEHVAMHYCFGHFRYPEWPNSSFYYRNLIIKTGLCLPDTCDSFSYDYHRDKIVKLALLNFGERHEGLYMSEMYCLPHHQSKLLEMSDDLLYKSFKIFVTIYMFIVITCTLFHFCLIIQNNARIKAEKKRELQEQLTTMIQLQTSDTYKQQQSQDGAANPASSRRLLLETLRADYFGMRIKQKRQIKHLRSLTEPELIPAFVGVFSIITNCRKLFSVESANDENKIAQHHDNINNKSVSRQVSRVVILDGIKGAAITIVVFGHCTMAMIIATFTTVQVKESFNMAISEYFFVAPYMLLNCFLVVTGTLTTMLLFKQGKKFIETPSNYILLTLLRYLRVMPLLLFVIWMTKAMYRALGHGPIWDYGTANISHGKICSNESWWLSIFFLNNLRQMNLQCTGQAWYLATDFQLFLITPPFLILMSKNHRLGYLACLMVCLTGLVASVITLMWCPLDKIIYLFKAPYNFSLIEEVHYYYTLPITRCGPYFMGLVCGHLLYRMNRGEFSPDSTIKHTWLQRWPVNTILSNNGDTMDKADAIKTQSANQNSGRQFKQRLVSFFKAHSALVGLIMTLLTFGSIPNYLFINTLHFEGSWNEPMVRFTLALFFSLTMNVFCLLVTIGIFFAGAGYDKTYYFSILKFRLWRPLGRASLSILLFHYILLLSFTFTNTTRLESSGLKSLITYIFGGGMVCITGSLTMCVLFEYPLVNSIELLVKNRLYRPQRSNNNTDVHEMKLESRYNNINDHDEQQQFSQTIEEVTSEHRQHLTTTQLNYAEINE